MAEYLEQFPGFAQARRAYEAVAKRVEETVGFDLYDEFQTQLLNYSDYEVCAYYAFGMGLRREIIRQMLGRERDKVKKAPQTDRDLDTP